MGGSSGSRRAMRASQAGLPGDSTEYGEEDNFRLDTASRTGASARRRPNVEAKIWRRWTSDGDERRKWHHRYHPSPLVIFEFVLLLLFTTVIMDTDNWILQVDRPIGSLGEHSTDGRQRMDSLRGGAGPLCNMAIAWHPRAQLDAARRGRQRWPCPLQGRLQISS